MSETMEMAVAGEVRSITAITDNAGNFVSPRDLEIRLQTLPTDEGYWLDTGVVNAAN